MNASSKKDKRAREVEAGSRHKQQASTVALQPQRTGLSQSPSCISKQNEPSNSKELLLAPKVDARNGQIGHDESPTSSHISSPEVSERPSSDSKMPFKSTNTPISCFEALENSKFPSRQSPGAASMDDVVNTQTVSERYQILPSSALVLFPEETEKDDWLHNPVLGEKEPHGCDIFSRRGLCNIGGLILVTLGTLMLFIGYPVVTFVELIDFPEDMACLQTRNCLSANLPLLQNARTGLIDPDTPSSVYTRIAEDGSKQNLVFSDEFNKPGRSFYPGDDAYWQGVDLWYGATNDLEWYDPDAISTRDGTLNIRFDQYQNHGLNYRSGMLQSWNQLCFKRGYIEASISLPGSGDTSGFWPGFWTMGNLGRPGYMATSDGLWPYSYHDECDLGITANQSQTDGISYLPGMRLPACTCPGETHPSPGLSRSAPEIDAIEASVSFLDPPDQRGVGTASQSYQVAPFDIWYQPNYDFVELNNSRLTTMNAYRGGPLQQAISGVTNLNNDWYDGKAYQSYGFEYTPGPDGYVAWFVGNQKMWSLEGKAIGPNGNIGQRVLSNEPMAIVMNLGMSWNFAFINLTGIHTLLPATMRVDYIRIYQDEEGFVGCDPPGYPTTEYIAKHPVAYKNSQKTTWKQTGYDWPRNSFVDGC